MYLLYLDASGSPLLSDKNTRHYVFAGVCMRESAWFALNKRLEGLKAKYAFPGMRFELHVSQFAVTIKEQDDIPDFDQISWTDRRAAVALIRGQKLAAEETGARRRKREEKYKQSEPFIHLSRGERSQLLEDAVQLISSHDNIRLFAEAIDKRHPLIQSAAADPVQQAFEQVVSRFDAYLQKVDAWKLQKGPRRSIDNGLLILDRDASTETTFERMFRRFRDHGHSFGQLRHVIDVPFFADSEKVSGLQIADVCAYVVRRYLDRGAVAGSHEHRQFLSIFQKFDRDNYGRLHGLRHYVTAGSCRCLNCQQRGHAP